MKTLLKILLLMAFTLFGCACSAQRAPKGKLTYCSYSRSGGGAMSRDYCELIADKDSVAKVVVALDVGNRFGDPETHMEFPVGPEVVEALQAGLAERKVYKLNGYNHEEPITGGHAYRIYQEYDSGEKINARWYGNKVKKQASAAYDYLEFFFEPWRKQAEARQQTP